MTLITEQTVCREIGVGRDRLREWVRLGWIQSTVVEGEPQYEPGEVRRIWSLVSLTEDLALDPGSAQMILELSDRVRELQAALVAANRQLAQLRRLEDFRRAALERFTGPSQWDFDL